MVVDLLLNEQVFHVKPAANKIALSTKSELRYSLFLQYRQVFHMTDLLKIENFFQKSVLYPVELFKAAESVCDVLSFLTDYVDNFSSWGLYSSLPSFAHIENKERVFIGEGVTIEPGAFIKGPCIIEAGATISHCALVRPYSIIGKDAVVGHASEVKGSILLEGAKLAHFNYVGDSIIGANVNLGAGVICANVRLDKKEIFLKVGQERVPTRKKKWGSVIGDCASIACNVVLNPGSLIAPNSFVRGAK